MITEAIAQKVLDTVDAGLCAGVGLPFPGQMCVEAAVCYALGLPHSDNPPCVSPVLRRFKIALNDAVGWSSPAARAAGMRQLAVLQLGSDGVLDEYEFSQRLAKAVIQKILPPLLCAVNLPQAATQCEQEGTKAAARNAARGAGNAAANAARAARNAAANAASAIADANAAARVAYAVHAASAIADANIDGHADTVLCQMADIAAEILIDMKVPGCQWLPLLDRKGPK